MNRLHQAIQDAGTAFAAADYAPWIRMGWTCCSVPTTSSAIKMRAHSALKAATGAMGRVEEERVLDRFAAVRDGVE